MTLVMVNGIPGRMAIKVAQGVIDSTDLKLLIYSLTGPGLGSTEISFGNNPIIPIKLIEPDRAEDTIAEMVNQRPFIAVDYTMPDAANRNAEIYCRSGVPFVMGTTGGDIEALERRVIESGNIALIAPNMAKEIVLLQAMVQYASESFPGALTGHKLEITESHQPEKADTSGTAKAMAGYFRRLGLPVSIADIRMIREPAVQEDMGVPHWAITGHAWHTYTIRSADRNLEIELRHNINGRDAYVAGTLDAIRYLQKKVEAGEKGKVYNMIDVLRGFSSG